MKFLYNYSPCYIVKSGFANTFLKWMKFWNKVTFQKLRKLSVPIILSFSLQFLVLLHKKAKMTLRILQGLVQLEVCNVYKNTTNFEAFFMAKFHYISHCPSLHISVHRQQRLKWFPFWLMSCFNRRWKWMWRLSGFVLWETVTHSPLS